MEFNGQKMSVSIEIIFILLLAIGLGESGIPNSNSNQRSPDDQLISAHTVCTQLCQFKFLDPKK